MNDSFVKVARNLAFAAGNLVGDSHYQVQECNVFDLSDRLKEIKDALDHFNTLNLKMTTQTEYTQSTDCSLMPSQHGYQFAGTTVKFIENLKESDVK